MTSATDTRTITRFDDLATRAAAHPVMQAAIQQTVQQHLPAVIEDCLRAMYGGGRVCFYVAKTPRGAREDRRRSVEQLLLAGMAPAVVAAKLRCSERLVQKIKRELPDIERAHD